MVVVECIDLRAVIEQEPGDLDRAGEMQRPPAIATLGMDEGWIARDQVPQLGDHAEIGRPYIAPEVWDAAPARARSHRVCRANSRA